jgi:hypothetical protein
VKSLRISSFECFYCLSGVLGESFRVKYIHRSDWETPAINLDLVRVAVELHELPRIADRFAAFGRIGSIQDEIERLCIWGSDDPPFEEDSPHSRQDAIDHWGGDRGGHRGVEVRRGHHDDVEVEKLVEAAVSAGAVVRCGGEPKTRCTA